MFKKKPKSTSQNISRSNLRSNNLFAVSTFVLSTVLLFACSTGKNAVETKKLTPHLTSQLTSQNTAPAVFPFSDPENTGQWTYNTVVSDEFEADVLDEDRWYIVGKFKDGKPEYKHPDKPNKKVWTGRAPSQFSGRNYRLEDGKLVLETRWEPDFPFIKEVHKPVFGEAMPYANITTACIISRKEFKYGYIEIKSKAADAEVTSAFWSMGKGVEFDFFELLGYHSEPGKEHLDRQIWWSIRDWQTLRGKPTYTERKDLGFRVADAFHIYGIEWNEQGVKYFIDGKLFSQVSAEEVTAWAKENRDVPADYDGYVATVPINLWLDQEVFPWVGYPKSKAELEVNSPADKKDDGVVDYEIEYVRVWQKTSDSTSNSTNQETKNIALEK